ncbi:hypothetical protein DFH07DRAFT_1060292 [Mycena maculata]|uniref:DUF6534 domain-containing protein n=1 Tax=Mycena maculata TaxID=230809 RepID=A0AAD7J8A3_9AGAR|nr:hypothetical protein DFH07DRAFT_1060292 [Mycena maculata]
MVTLSGEQRPDINLQLGPWLVGTGLDLLLQGVVSSQIVNYYGWYRDDNKNLKITVAILGIMTVLKSVQAFAIIWIQLIVHYGDLEGAILLNFTAWWEIGHPLMVAVIGLYVQGYFCFRLWVISKSWVPVIPLGILFVFAFFSIIVATYFIATGNVTKIGTWCIYRPPECRLQSGCPTYFIPALIDEFSGGDLILSMTTAYFLLKVKKNCHPSSVGLISALVRLTFQTAAPAAICAMLNLIAAQVWTGNDGIIATAFNMALPKLYAISMMWTLNARATIRAQHSTRYGTSNPPSNELSAARSRAQRTHGEMELRAIQILSQTETTRHVDVRDMFEEERHREQFKRSRTQSRGTEKSQVEARADGHSGMYAPLGTPT